MALGEDETSSADEVQDKSQETAAEQPASEETAESSGNDDQVSEIDEDSGIIKHAELGEIQAILVTVLGLWRP